MSIHCTRLADDDKASVICIRGIMESVTDSHSQCNRPARCTGRDTLAKILTDARRRRCPRSRSLIDGSAIGLNSALCDELRSVHHKFTSRLHALGCLWCSSSSVPTLSNRMLSSSHIDYIFLHQIDFSSSKRKFCSVVILDRLILPMQVESLLKRAHCWCIHYRFW